MKRIIATLVLALSTSAAAETAEEIMDKARAARQVDNSIQKVKMIIVSKSGSDLFRRDARSLDIPRSWSIGSSSCLFPGSDK